MKTFEEVDVFIPDESSKVHMKAAYNIFNSMVEDISRQLEEKTYKNGLLMLDYAPDYMIPMCVNYGLKLYYDEQDDNLYLTLVYIYSDGSKNEPLCYVNVNADKRIAFNCSEAAYILMICFINHLGVMMEKSEA